MLIAKVSFIPVEYDTLEEIEETMFDNILFNGLVNNVIDDMVEIQLEKDIINEQLSVLSKYIEKDNIDRIKKENVEYIQFIT